MKQLKSEVKNLLQLLESIKDTRSRLLNIRWQEGLDKAWEPHIIESNENDEGYRKLIDSNTTQTAKITVKQTEDDILKVASKGNKDEYLLQKQLLQQYQTTLDIAINLNKLLQKPIKKVLSIEEIKHKELLTVKDVELLYGFSKTQQQGFRGRIRNSLPQVTKSRADNSKVHYRKQELDDWIDNFL